MNLSLNFWIHTADSTVGVSSCFSVSQTCESHLFVLRNFYIAGAEHVRAGIGNIDFGLAKKKANWSCSIGLVSDSSFYELLRPTYAGSWMVRSFNVDGIFWSTRVYQFVRAQAYADYCYLRLTVNFRYFFLYLSKSFSSLVTHVRHDGMFMLVKDKWWVHTTVIYRSIMIWTIHLIWFHN